MSRAVDPLVVGATVPFRVYLALCYVCSPIGRSDAFNFFYTLLDV